MENHSTSSETKIVQSVLKSWSSGFTIAEFLVSTFVFTLVIMGIFNLVSVNLLSLQISKNRIELGNVAYSQLQQLKEVTKCSPLDSLLEVCGGSDCEPKYQEVIVEKRSVTCEWRTYEENVTDNERVKTYRIELYAYFTDNPVKTKKYVATKVCYQE